MKKIFLFLGFLIVLFLFFLNHSQANAQKGNLSPAITIINLIRGNGLGHEKDDLTASLKAQWQVTREQKVNATWLLQYGALEKKSITDFAKNQMPNQEFGLLFEIDRNFAQKSGVAYRGQGPWYFSDGLFLISYDINERKKLIDSAFSKFKETFGYYPKTVGAWWIGGDSLLYMQGKYKITAALRAADQFNLDFYSIWGTPWNIPYLSSKDNQGIPAKSLDESSKVVILQWAARDPLKGYADATYSLQDYPMKGYKTEYVNYLASIFLKNPLGNLVIGLENGGTLETFGGFYKPMLQKAKELEKDQKAKILLAKDYSSQFLKQGKVIQNNYFLSNGYNLSDQSFWYISQNYRATIQKNKDGIYLIDVRDYSNKIEEDFKFLPNSQAILRINQPQLIDSNRFPKQKILIKTSEDPITLKEKNKEVELYLGKEKFAHFTSTFFKINDRVFTFNKERPLATPLNILIAIYVFYFLFIYFFRNKRISLIKTFLPLLIPFFLASFFFEESSIFLLDRKEIFLFNFFPFSFLSLTDTLTLFKILPFIVLIVLNYIFIKYPGRIKKISYISFLILISFLYLHLPYFPLDKTTYVFVITAFALSAIVLLSTAIFIRGKSKKAFVMFAIAIPFLLFSFAFATVFSRTKLALTNFELDALSAIKNQRRDVLYVEQVSPIRPIYKAVKPALYDNYKIGGVITAKKWRKVLRPSNHILKISDYDNKLIVVPKYLGADLSQYEINLLKLSKIFDNAQIQIFEKL
ncbi:MAG: hypothetical protein A2W22_06585 [Candidatus Levybacteria bacterium RBG_16_35_11]|nr:MAG: hypothetical protein A2W22_06585 [Candidatus Levybacteria bacterium RBG_16_35_11]